MALAAIDTVPITDKAADFQTEDLPADKAETELSEGDAQKT